MKKEKIITIRVSEEEYDLIIEKAVKLGLSISAYLRMLGLKDWYGNYCNTRRFYKKVKYYS